MDDQSRPAPRDEAVAATFKALADLVYTADTFEEMFTAVVDAAPTLVTGCDHASLMLHEGDRLETAAASDEVAGNIDAMERELGEGPCVDAIVDEAVFHDADLNDGSPWPRLAERVLAETPVRGMAGVRLRAGSEKAGALNLFSDRVDALTDVAVAEGMVLASFLEVAVLAARERRQAATLREGMQTNREIGKAVGLMMAFHKISDEEAFDMLRRTSQDLNLKLRDVAQRVVDHHNQG